MSKLLLSISHIADDPSTHLVNYFQHQFLKGESEPQASTSKGSKSICNQRSPIDSVSISAVQSQNGRASRSTQVGNSLKKIRNAGIQCRGSAHRKESKATTVDSLRNTKVDRGIGAIELCTKEDAQTNSVNPKICNDHRRVFALLAKWPTKSAEDRIEENIMKRIKTKLLDFIKFFDAEKIDVNQYYSPDQNVFKLYRCASFYRPKDPGKNHKLHDTKKSKRKKRKKNVNNISNARVQTDETRIVQIS